MPQWLASLLNLQKNTNSSQTLPKSKEEEHFSTHFMWPVSNLLPKPNKATALENYAQYLF